MKLKKNSLLSILAISLGITTFTYASSSCSSFTSYTSSNSSFPDPSATINKAACSVVNNAIQTEYGKSTSSNATSAFLMYSSWDPLPISSESYEYFYKDGVNYYNPAYTYSSSSVSFTPSSFKSESATMTDCTGSSQLTNNTTTTQTLTSSSCTYSKSVTNSMTATSGWEVSGSEAIEISGTLDIPLFDIQGKSTTTVSASYNNSSSSTVSEEDTISYTASSQSVSVPAGCTAEVDEYLILTNNTGSYTLYNTVENPVAVVSYQSADGTSGYNYYDLDLPNLFSYENSYGNLQSDIPSSISYSNGSLQLTSSGTYNVTGSTDFYVDITFKDNPGHPGSCSALSS